jgi:hypothetical protein
MRWAEHAVRMREIRKACRILVMNLKERGGLADLVVYRVCEDNIKIVLREIACEDV